MAEEKDLVETKDEKEEQSSEQFRDEVEKKIRKEIEKKQEKQETMGFYRIAEYLKTEHKWENYLFVFVSLVVMVLGGMILAGSLVVRDSFPLIGKHPVAFAWILMGIAFIALIYSLYPFFKPAFPEFKKITWLTFAKFVGDSIRVFLFIAIFVLLFILYDSLITGLLRLIL
jgi:preprotein translocase subunit SecE